MIRLVRNIIGLVAEKIFMRKLLSRQIELQPITLIPDVRFKLEESCTAGRSMIAIRTSKTEFLVSSGDME